MSTLGITLKSEYIFLTIIPSVVLQNVLLVSFARFLSSIIRDSHEVILSKNIFLNYFPKMSETILYFLAV